ncbi:hypothetical protein D9M71_92850 [compost metagenome]
MSRVAKYSARNDFQIRCIDAPGGSLCREGRPDRRPWDDHTWEARMRRSQGVISSKKLLSSIVFVAM